MKTIRSMFEQLYWADKRMLDALEAEGDGESGAEAVRLLSHTLRAEQVWFTRLQGQDSNHLPLWPNDSLDDCKRLAQEMREAFTAYLAELTAERLDDVLTYRNQFGRSYQTSVRDILTHLALHGQYHRGQVNMKLRSAGMEPVNVDYITFVRQQGQ
ncbi:putative damage-inducible protein DinB [Paenibacillus rhizosphaerae]|uniref:Putative damage-inducible protein DinB n=1 Tax=Paenibacillus rhizosphaerae TaxID=297318 RepID=A0A839TFG1_9BACL|nr:DinB family protein [Paenibacillus rhizosphaerae]MBB3125535.1 putative damage-inducible protein DinB [Paenibacillus rhizosphaerae]